MLCPTAPSLPWVAWASLPHLQRYYSPLRLPSVPLGSLRLSLASRYLACFRAFVVSLAGSCPGGSPSNTPGPLVTRSPTPGFSSRRQVALPSSRVPPMKTCPALRPRWCPAHSPSRTQDCCLPALANRRLSPLYHFEGYPPVHNYTHFEAQSRGLPSRYARLRTAPYGEARGFTTDRLARH
jgi:hypothetical protein